MAFAGFNVSIPDEDDYHPTSPGHTAGRKGALTPSVNATKFSPMPEKIVANYNGRMKELCGPDCFYLLVWERNSWSPGVCVWGGVAGICGVEGV